MRIVGFYCPRGGGVSVWGQYKWVFSFSIRVWVDAFPAFCFWVDGSLDCQLHIDLCR